MEEIMNGIIVPGPTPEKCIRRERLERYTTRIPAPYVKKIPWSKLEHLYIFGTAMDHTRVEGQDFPQPGAYVDVYRKWALLVGVEDGEVQKHLSRCSAGLEKLAVRFTGVQELSVRKLTGLRTLLLERNRKLCQLLGLEQLQELRKLYLTQCAVTEIWLPHPLPRLTTLDVNRSRLENADFLTQCPELRVANLSGTCIRQLPYLRYLEGLSVLSLANTPLETLGPLSISEDLTVLNLSGTAIKRLPLTIGYLKKLKTLDLSNLRLEDLPTWLPNLGLEFTRGDGEGIRLGGTTIGDIDMSIFDQPREMIVQWLDVQERERWKKAWIWNTNLFNFSFSNHFSGTPRFLTSDRRDNSTRLTHSLGIHDFDLPFLFTLDKSGSMGSETIFPSFVEPFVPTVRDPWAPFDFSKYYHIYTLSLQPWSPPEQPSFLWRCGRYTPRPTFSDEKWDIEAYRRAFERRTPLYFPDGKPEETPPEEVEEVSKPLNELKIIFLGDGEAGKSHTIARLLHDGEQSDDFPDHSTPGIVIKNKTYEIGGRSIQVHFWDFGGQEILHSMHRMFLTEKTMYVVMVNVRVGDQEERARYWLHNLRSFAKDAPVLLVLNKMDMNRNASVNEHSLRELYPNLVRVVKTSAVEDSPEYFRQNLIGALTEQIGAFRYLDSPFLAAWSRVKQRLQTMPDPYIQGSAYRAICDECGVVGSDDVRTGLLNWFSNLGVSFCYNDSPKLEDYVVLRPDWITNAIYIILFNKMEEIKNGLVTHDTIYRMLRSTDTEHIRRTVEGIVYEVPEVAFVLNVIRKFQLSFLVEDGVEFMPMLCDANAAPVAEDYARDPDVLEFRMHYEYLPNNVIHRLMVSRREELDRKNVWLTGARFVWGTTGLSALVRCDGNLLTIQVRAEKKGIRASLYLDQLKDALEKISADMNLTISKMEVPYRIDGRVEYFSYKKLLNSLRLGLKYIAPEEGDELIPIDDILKQSDRPADEAREKLLRDITLACERLQNNNDYWGFKEDSLTRVIQEKLEDKGYFTQGQKRGGISFTGKQAGELDLDIRLEPEAQWTILEALNLDSDSESEKKYWNAHLKKLLDNYNPLGLPFLFHVSYVKCKKGRFGEICDSFADHIRRHSPEGFSVESHRTKTILPAEGDYRENQFLRAVRSSYRCGSASMIVYHFFVRIGQ